MLRTQSRLMLDGTVTLLTSYATWLESIRLHATCYSATWRDGRLHIELDAVMYAGDLPLHLETDGENWFVPIAAAPSVDAADRLVTPEDLATVDLDCATVSRSDAQLWSTTEGLSLSIATTGAIEVAGEVVIDPATVQGGQELDAGLWDLRLRVMFGGLTRGATLHPAGDAEPGPVDAWAISTTAEQKVVQPYWTFPSPVLALDVAEWSHPLVDLLDVAAAPELRRRRLRAGDSRPSRAGDRPCRDLDPRTVGRGVAERAGARVHRGIGGWGPIHCEAAATAAPPAALATVATLRRGWWNTGAHDRLGAHPGGPPGASGSH